MPNPVNNFENIRSEILYKKISEPNFVKTFIEEVYSYLVDIKEIKNPIATISKTLSKTSNFNFSALSKDELKQLIKDVLYFDSFDRHEDFEYTSAQLNELTYLLLELNQSKNNDILDLCSRSGTFITTILDSKSDDNLQNTIYANECFEKYAYISKLISEIFNNGYTKVEVSNKDIFKEPLNIKFDKARIFAPFGIKKYLENKSEILTTIFEDVPFKSIVNSEWAFIDRALSNKKENFRAVAMVPGKNLWDIQSSLYRNHIIKNGYLEGIIELPAKVLPFTNLQLYLLILSNNNKNIKFIDASSLIIKNTSRFSKRERMVTLDIGSILDAYYDCNNIKTIEETLKLKNLAPSLVNIKKKEIKNGVPLCELAEVYAGNCYTLKNFQEMISEYETGYSILQSTDIDNYFINTENLVHIKYKDTKFDKYCIQYGDLVVTSKSSKVKVGVVDFDPKEKIIVTGGMIIVRPNKEKLNPIYLKVFLDSELGKQSLKAIQKGTTIIAINLKDFSEIKTPYIELKKQEIIAKQYQRKVSSLIALRNEANEIEEQLSSFLDEAEEN